MDNLNAVFQIFSSSYVIQNIAQEKGNQICQMSLTYVCDPSLIGQFVAAQWLAQTNFFTYTRQ